MQSPLVRITPLLLVTLFAAGAQAAVDLPKPSPAATVSQRVGLTDVRVEYSSPAVKGRKVWGELVPYGELWRTGANAATKITLSGDAKVAGVDVKAGTYALLTIPRKGKWTLILNADANLPGTRGYDEKKDVARAEVSARPVARRERLTFLFSDTTDDRSDLVLEWDRLGVVIPIEVATASQAAANIDAAVKAGAGDLTMSARYLLDEDKDATRALDLAERAADMDPTWINTWVLARALAANGRHDEAVVAARKAHELGMKAEYFFWKADVEKAIDDWSKKAR